jgi:hypothetical protein
MILLVLPEAWDGRIRSLPRRIRRRHQHRPSRMLVQRLLNGFLCLWCIFCAVTVVEGRRTASEPAISVGRSTRGGGISRGNHGSIKYRYRQALEDQILWLEQQLRLVQEEKLRLKGLYRKQQRQSKQSERSVLELQSSSVSTTTTSLSPSEFLSSLSSLESQQADLHKTKRDLERLLQEYNQKLDSLARKFVASENEYHTVEQELQSQVTALQEQLEKWADDAKQQLPTEIEQEKLLQRRILQAQDQAIVDFWKDTGNLQLERLRRTLEEQHSHSLQRERHQTQVAVQKQREKMRALARAMALREQQLHQQEQEAKGYAQQQEHEEQDRLILTAQEEKEERRKRIQQAQDEAQRMLQETRESKEREELERRQKKKQEKEQRKEKLREGQDKAKTVTVDPRDSQTSPPSPAKGTSFLSRLVPGKLSRNDKRHTKATDPKPSIENWQRRVPWQPISLPPPDVVQVSPPR